MISPRRLRPFFAWKGIFLGIAIVFTPNRSDATDGSWNVNANGTWSTPGNWLAGQIADGVGAVGNLTFNITVGRNVTIDTAEGRTLGVLNIGDPTSAFGSYTVNATNGGTLTMNNAALGAEINATSPSGNAAVSAPVVLGDRLTLANVGNGIFTLSGGISGAGNLILKNGGATASGITVSGAINHAGILTNAGVGSAPPFTGSTTRSLDKSVSITGTIGSNVTDVTQDSASSVMDLNAANAYTGATRVKAGTLVLSNTAAASTSVIRLGEATETADAALRTRGVNIANDIIVEAGGSGSASIGSASNTSTVTGYSGSISLGKTAILSPFSSKVTFNGLISGEGGIIAASIGRAMSGNGVGFGISGGNTTLIRSDNTNLFSGDVEVAAGTLSLTSSTANVDMSGLLGTGNSAVRIGRDGSESARLLIEAGAAGQSFSREAVIQAGGGGIAAVGASGNNAVQWNGAIRLDKSGHLSNGSNTVEFRGAISKGSGAVGATSITTYGAGVVKLMGENSHDGGSVAGGVLGTLWGTGAGAFGTGNILAETGVVRFDDQTALASGKGVHVGERGAIVLGVNTSSHIAYIASVLDKTSSGAVVFSTNISQSVDLAEFGNGMMRLGASSNMTYTASSLGANADGNYYLGYSNIRIDLSKGVVVGDSAKATIGVRAIPSALGGSGNVSFFGDNTYGGGTEVFNGSTLRGKQQATSGSPFGSTTGAMTLHGGMLLLESPGSTSSATTVSQVGEFSFGGGATVKVQGPTSGGGENLLQVGQITRIGKGVVGLGMVNSGTLGETAKIKTSGGALPSTIAGVAGGGTVQMLAPYFVDATFAAATDYTQNANFMAYDATKGFYAITNAYTTLSGAPTNAIVKIVEATTVNSDQTIHALSFSVPSGGYTVTNTSGADRTLTVTSGGVNFDARNTASLGLGASAANQRIHLNFAGQEAIFNVTTGNNQALSIYGNIHHASGITKAGNGTLQLSGTGSTFEGDITILGGGNGGVLISNDLSLGGVDAALSNGIVFEGGRLVTDGNFTLNASRTITIGYNGGEILTRNSGGYGARDVVIASKITGTNGGYLWLSNGMVGGEYNTVASSFRLTNAANDFVAPILIGGGNNGPLAVIFDADSQLGAASNSLTLMGGNALLRYAGSDSFSSQRRVELLDLGGNLEVLSADAEWRHEGGVTGSGLLNKLGEGRLTLSGSNAYTGNTIVSSGVLRATHSYSLGASTAVVSGSSGVSGGGVYVHEGATLEMEGDLALSGIGGKTTYLNGHGVSNGGALRNVSGANSNAGTVILQTASTIGADAGKLTLSGEVRGASLVKVGVGALELTGANTYSGGTVVSAGTLILNNASGSATGSGDLTLGSAILTGAGTVSGAVTTSGTYSVIAPGNSPGKLTMGALDASAGAMFQFELGSVSDSLDLGSGAFIGSSAAGGLVFNLIEASGLAEGNYTLITFGSSSGLDYSDIVAHLALGNYTLDLNYGTNGFLIGDDRLSVQLTSIPETSSVLLLLAGIGLVWFVRRPQGS